MKSGQIVGIDIGLEINGYFADMAVILAVAVGMTIWNVSAIDKTSKRIVDFARQSPLHAIDDELETIVDFPLHLIHG